MRDGEVDGESEGVEVGEEVSEVVGVADMVPVRDAVGVRLTVGKVGEGGREMHTHARTHNYGRSVKRGMRSTSG